MNVTEPFNLALAHTRRLLFRPFDIGVWFSLGFIFFLEQLGEGGKSTNFRLPGGGGGKGGAPGSAPDFGSLLRDAHRWALDHATQIAIVGSIVLVLALILLTVLLWLSCRGQMMAVHAVARVDVRVGEAWRATREPAWSLFLFRLVLGAAGLVISAPLFVLGGLRAIELLERGTSLGPMDYLTALAPFAILFAFAAIAFALVSSLLSGFVVPMMWHFRIPCVAAWRRLGAIAQQEPAAILGYLGIRFALSIAIGLVAVVATMLTCCIGGLPVLHQTLLAPVYAFDRAYSLFVLQSLGPEYQLITPEPPPAPPYGGYAPPAPYGGYGAPPA